MRLRSIIPVLALSFAPWVARAQPIQGVYVGVGAGLRFPQSIKNTPLTPAIKGNFDLSQSLGVDTQLSVGYALGNGWRFELEGTYGRSSVSGTSGTSFPATSGGRVRNLGVMANALFDLDVGSPYVYPYLGVGVGYQSTRLDGFTLSRADKPLVFTASGDAGGFAAQAIAGVSFPIPNMPGLSITADYRFMDILGGETFNGTTSVGGGAPVVSATKFHNQFNQTVMFGVRYAFNTPPPAGVAPQAMAEPTQPRTYAVNFGLDIVTLTDRDRSVVKAAAMDSLGRQTTHIAVTGNASTPADRMLSQRRTEAVAAALIGDGVPKEVIVIQSEETAGTDQSRGRRVEIVTQ
jgi:OmpA-OmpF porin, OOP family